MNREEINARIFNHFKHELSPYYKVINVRTQWIGQREGIKFFRVRYFVTSSRFLGGVRFDTISIKDKTIKVLNSDTNRLV